MRSEVDKLTFGVKNTKVVLVFVVNRIENSVVKKCLIVSNDTIMKPPYDITPQNLHRISFIYMKLGEVNVQC